jgi:ATP-binding cassette, subfamily B, bacterial
MDRILVFDKGRIVEEGSQEELVAKKGRFAKMWQMQAGGFLP